MVMGVESTNSRYIFTDLQGFLAVFVGFLQLLLRFFVYFPGVVSDQHQLVLELLVLHGVVTEELQLPNELSVLFIREASLQRPAQLLRTRLDLLGSE